jgi:hypothetical protein
MHQEHAFAVSPARAVATAGSDLPAGGTGRLVMAVFDELSSLSGALQPLHDQHTRLIHHQGGTQSDAASTIRASLEADQMDVVVWDVSPALSLYCDRLEGMLDRQAFAGCALIVTTTHAARLHEYFGMRCREMTLLQRPFSTQQIDAAIGSAPRLPR